MANVIAIDIALLLSHPEGVALPVNLGQAFDRAGIDGYTFVIFSAQPEETYNAVQIARAKRLMDLADAAPIVQFAALEQQNQEDRFTVFSFNPALVARDRVAVQAAADLDALAGRITAMLQPQPPAEEQARQLEEEAPPLKSKRKKAIWTDREKNLSLGFVLLTTIAGTLLATYAYKAVFAAICKALLITSLGVGGGTLVGFAVGLALVLIYLFISWLWNRNPQPAPNLRAPVSGDERRPVNSSIASTPDVAPSPRLAAQLQAGLEHKEIELDEKGQRVLVPTDNSMLNAQSAVTAPAFGSSPIILSQLGRVDALPSAVRFSTADRAKLAEITRDNSSLQSDFTPQALGMVPQRNTPAFPGLTPGTNTHPQSSAPSSSASLSSASASVSPPPSTPALPSGHVTIEIRDNDEKRTGPDTSILHTDLSSLTV